LAAVSQLFLTVNRTLPGLILWIILSVYWTAASRNSSSTKSAESKLSTGSPSDLALCGARSTFLAGAPPASYHVLVALALLVVA